MNMINLAFTILFLDYSIMYFFLPFLNMHLNKLSKPVVIQSLKNKKVSYQNSEWKMFPHFSTRILQAFRYPCNFTRLRFFRHSADLGPRMLIFCPWRGQTVDSLSPHLYPVSVFMLWKQCVLLWALKCYFSMQIVGLLCISHTLTNKCLLFSRNLFPLLCRAGAVSLLGIAVRCLVKWVGETPARWPGFGRSWLTDPMVVQTCPLISSGLYALGSLEVVERPVVPAQRLG